ncbi:MAG: MBL fold metallo-hydrolase [Deltaproteobacteria bacterium]|nr:MBL fold metallo-hydrolase [Deltaproteobacteria bacterium]
MVIFGFIRKTFLVTACLGIVTSASGFTFAQSDGPEATGFTKDANTAVLKSPALKWEDKQDEEFARRGFIATDQELVLKDAAGNVIWSNKEYDGFLKGEAPLTVNPSLWRHAVLNSIHGLFKVTDGVYQVRGQSISNMTIIEGKTGYIVFDPHISVENAKNNLALVFRHVGRKPVVAVIYSHSHIDHFGGVKGVTSEEDVKSGKTRIIAPKGFMEAAMSENVLAGNVMSRRAMYMYGNLLERGPKGQIDAGAGKTAEAGTGSIIAPTQVIEEQAARMEVDGVELVFQLAPGEAPANMHVYLPQKKTLYIADNCFHTIHNIYTIRGARTRDARAWADSIEQGLRFEDAEVLIAGHNWPCFGKDNVREHMNNQIDALRYVHDQTLRLMNQGYKPGEIAELIELPPSLAVKWPLRNYYGHVKHDVKGIYSLYLGWYDGNPANLDPLPPRETGKLMVEYMGGADAVIGKAQKAFDQGQYRWVAQVLDYVVWAEPANKKARELAAAAFNQLGYQTENATWRNAYLTAAYELREGVQSEKGGSAEGRGAFIMAIPYTDLLDALSVRLNGPRAFGKQSVINWDFTDSGEKYVTTLRNAVLSYKKGSSPQADVTLSLSRLGLLKLLSGMVPLELLETTGEVRTQGAKEKLKELLGLFDRPSPTFPIATHEPIGP